MSVKITWHHVSIIAYIFCDTVHGLWKVNYRYIHICAENIFLHVNNDFTSSLNSIWVQQCETFNALTLPGLKLWDVITKSIYWLYIYIYWFFIYANCKLTLVAVTQSNAWPWTDDLVNVLHGKNAYVRRSCVTHEESTVWSFYWSIIAVWNKTVRITWNSSLFFSSWKSSLRSRRNI